MNYEEILNNAIINKRNENYEDIYKNYQNNEYQEKIIKYAQVHNLDIADINQEIKNKNKIIASIFVKDPLKQNISEKVCAKYLDIKKLPAGGLNCIRFNENGDIVSKKGKNISKSADFYYDQMNMYITQKYTKEDGGSQDNQMDDVIRFLNNGSKKHRVGAIVDGGYWSKHREELKKEFQENSNVFIYTADEFKTMKNK